jgi:hypothetical protein
LSETACGVAAIVVGRDACDQVQAAANTLSQYVFEASGARLPIVRALVREQAALLLALADDTTERIPDNVFLTGCFPDRPSTDRATSVTITLDLGSGQRAEGRNLKSQISNLKSQNVKPQIWNLESEIGNRKFSLRARLALGVDQR